MEPRSFLAREHQRYALISPGALYETAVQALVARHLPALLPEWMGGRCEPLLRTPAGDVRPDLIAIRRDFSGWAVIEVEVETHSFRGHVLPQVAKLTYSEADDSLSDKVHREVFPLLNVEDIRLALSSRPQVFLITHGDTEVISDDLQILGVEALDIQIHQATTNPNDYVVQVADKTITLDDLGVTAVRSSNPMTALLWVIDGLNPAALGDCGSSIEVSFKGTLARWAVRPAGAGVILRQPSGLAKSDDTFMAKVLIDRENGILHLDAVG